MTDFQIEILPDAAKRELANFYEYLVFKYVKNTAGIKKSTPNKETAKNLAAFHKLKKLRQKFSPTLDKSIDIDQLCNEVNCDIGTAL